MRAREPDAPAAELRRAVWWRRLLAGLIDGFVVVTFVALIVWRRVVRRRGSVGLGIEAERAEERHVLVARLLGSVLALLRRLGETPGFRIAGLEVRDRVSGRRPALGRALVRTAIDELPTWVTRWATGAARERDRARRAELLRTVRDIEALAARGEGDTRGVRGAAEKLHGERPAIAWRFFAEQLLVSLLVRAIAAPLRRRLDARVVTVRRGARAAPRAAPPRTR